MKRLRRFFDPIDLEILWNRLILVVDEAAYAIVRTSMSKVVTEGRDFGSLLLDPKGRLLAADVSVASKTGTISIVVKPSLNASRTWPISEAHCLVRPAKSTRKA
jgi:N-methylhydantoinase B